MLRPGKLPQISGLSKLVEFWAKQETWTPKTFAVPHQPKNPVYYTGFVLNRFSLTQKYLISSISDIRSKTAQGWKILQMFQ